MGASDWGSVKPERERFVGGEGGGGGRNLYLCDRAGKKERGGKRLRECSVCVNVFACSSSG